MKNIKTPLQRILSLAWFAAFAACSANHPLGTSVTSGTTGASSTNTAASSSSPSAWQFFASSSIWNRPVPSDAVYAEIQDALLGDPSQPVNRLYMESITVLTVSSSAPLVDLKLGSGWAYPDRATPTGGVLAQFHLSSESGVSESTRTGNGHFAVFDPGTSTLYQGIALWRDPGSSTILSHHYFPSKNVGAYSDMGTNGYRGGGISALGGMILPGEINTGIRHALAVLVNARKLYGVAPYFVWPANKADTAAPDPVNGYHGTNSANPMGSLLVIPQSVSLSSYAWKTVPGRMIAQAARDYGLYVADDNATTNAFAFAMIGSAFSEIGLSMNTTNGAQTMNPAILNYGDFFSDTIQTLTLLKAVVNNHP